MAPVPAEQVDLVFISHGHNHDVGELEREAPLLFADVTELFPNAAVVNIAQNPEREASPHRATQESGVIALRNWSVRQGYPTIDVFTPFSEQDVEALIDATLYHPTEQGYQFWSDVVNGALDAADPQ